MFADGRKESSTSSKVIEKRFYTSFFSVLLPIFAITIVVALATSNRIIFTVTFRVRKSDNYCYRDNLKSDNYRKHIKGKRQRNMLAKNEKIHLEWKIPGKMENSRGN